MINSTPAASPPRPAADPDLATSLAGAIRTALAELPPDARDAMCLVALVTTGEGLRPYLSITTHDDDPWNLHDSRYALVADDHCERWGSAWNLRWPDIAELDGDQADAQFGCQLATMEEALRQVDVGGGFGSGEAPEPPNPTLADLWEMTPGWYAADGTGLYGPHSWAERNTTYEVDTYAPAWVLVGDDSGGGGYFMRRGPLRFDPAEGRRLAEVFWLDLGVGSADIATDGAFVTDDLIGWAARR